MRVIEQMGFRAFADRLREAGLSIGEDKLRLLIKRGYVGNAAVCVEMRQNEFLILTRDVEDWIAAHSSPVELPAEIAAVVEANGGGGSP